MENKRGDEMRKGFTLTLVETMIVVAIIALLIAIAIPEKEGFITRREYIPPSDFEKDYKRW
ncbi:MAG TPA: hypothetical protein ENH85_12580 [Candidatus Scalindua sp.]|nr:hypothetical protein [Candidatus Scalindua sp.]